MPHLLRIPRNQAGRDFVVGDIHFKTRELHKGLLALGFDKSVDRLIAVGDLIDRGPGMLDGLKLLGTVVLHSEGKPRADAHRRLSS